MNLKDVEKLIQMFRDGDLSELDWEEETFRLSLRRGAADQVVATAPPQTVMMAAPAAPPSAAVPAPAAPPPPAQDEDSGLAAITSPMVGTFYAAPTPEAEPYVSVGSTVTEDTVVCIVEAMKVMNEIKAEKRGVIRKILVEPSTPVQFGEKLFLIE